MRPFQRRDFNAPTFQVVDAPFLVPSDLLTKLRPAMLAAAKTIQEAIASQRRIFLRHHSDTDGFCAGIALERAILPLVEASNEKKQAVWEKYRRMPSPSPYFHIEDVTKDVAQFLTLGERFGEKPPLVILADLGSGPENVLPIKQLRMFGCDVIVIDHHPIDPEIDALVQHHINPSSLMEDPPSCAGLLCAELSRFIYEGIFGEDLLAAVACVGDRVSEVVAKPYFNMVATQGYDEAMLLKIAKALDFTVYNMRNVEGRELVGVILGDNRDIQVKLVELLNEELRKREEKIFTQAMSIIHIEEGERVQIARLAIDQLTIRDGYPRLGNIVGMVSDYLKREKKVTKPLIMLGTLPNQITFRAADETAFNYPYVQQLVASKVPLSFVEGGGHPHAGTFRFAESQYKAVWEVVHEYLRGL